MGLGFGTGLGLDNLVKLSFLFWFTPLSLRFEKGKCTANLKCDKCEKVTGSKRGMSLRESSALCTMVF